MDSLSAHQRISKEAKARSKKKKQVKVVYISNPMRFKASASEFKGLVQQFTGQDSDVVELSKFAGVADHCDDHSGGASADRASFSTDDDSAGAVADLSRPGAALQQQEPYRCVGPPQPFDEFDDVFTPQVLENLAAFMPTSLYYEAPSPVV